MSFLLGMNLDFFRPHPRLVNVGEVLVKDIDEEERVSITCFKDTGTLFMDGRFAPAHLTIGETLNWYLSEPITDIDIEDLFFDNLVNHRERPAHAWEKRTFLLGHWRQYAKNNIHVRVVIRLGDEENESVCIPIREDAHTSNKNRHEQPPKPLVIHPFS